MRFERHYRWLLTGLLLVALALRLAAGAWWQERLPPGMKFGFGDSDGYWELGRAISHGGPYEYGGWKVFRTPGYPAVLAPLFWLQDEPPVYWARAISAVLATAAVGLTALLAQLLFGPRAAILAAAISTFYPEAISLGAFVLSEAPFTPLMLLQLILWTLAWRSSGHRERVAWSLSAGAAAGLATLMRPSWLLFTPFAFGIGVTLFGEQRKQAAIFGLIVVGLCGTMLPWWVRNFQVAGRFVPTSLQIGASLYDGLSPTATGASEMSFVNRFVAEQQAADQQPGADTSGLFEDRLDRRLRNAALRWAGEHPSDVLRLAGVKFLRMWSPLPNAAEFKSNSLRLILAATYLPVLLLAIAGAWRYARRDWPYLLCVLPALYFTCLHVIFVSSIRYRQPAMLALIVLAAALVAEVRGQETGVGVRRHRTGDRDAAD